MVVARHNFDGGPHAATITVANSAQVPGNDPFQATSSGSGGLLQYISGQGSRPTAEYVMGMATSSTGNPTGPYVAWTTTVGDQAEIWVRFYFYPTEVVSTNANDLNLFAVANTSALGTGVWLQTSTSPFVLYIKDSAATPNTVMMTTPLDVLVWHRIEFHVIMGATTGQADLSIYAYPDTDEDSVDYTERVSQTGGTYGAAPATQYILGQGWAIQKGTPDTYFSNLEINDTGYPGPEPFRMGKGSPSGNMTNSIAIHMS